MTTYLEALTVRLALGATALPAELRARHAEYLRSVQQPDGGWTGREGESDLYYTGFGLRGLAMLDCLDEAIARRAAGFLQARLTGRESIVDFFSLIYGAALLQLSAEIDVFAQHDPGWCSSVAQAMEDLRRDDGGYAKGPDGHASSTYHTFLVLLCLQLIGEPIPQSEAIVRFIDSQRSVDGGFLEIRAGKRAGTNPTAAAVAVLRMLGALDDRTRQHTAEFLADMQTEEGGLRANTRIPIADLLSTFTGLLTLADLGEGDGIDRAAAARFVQSLQAEEGGFHGAAWDADRDVEYTFYGIGSMALLQDAL